MRNKFLLFFLLLSTITYSQVVPLSFLKTRQPVLGYSQRYSVPGVVASNLVLNLDAGIDESYIGTGNTWKDLSRTNDGTISNFTYSSSPRSLIFNGSQNPVTGSKAKFSKGITEGDYLTYETWINKIGPSTAFFSVIANSDAWSTGYVHFQFHGNILYFDLNGSGDISSGLGLETIPLNKWHQLVVVYSTISKTVKFYVNGELKSTVNLSRTPKIAFQKFTIGAWDDNGNLGRYFDGKIAVFRAYDIALDATQVLANYNALKSRFAPTATLTGTQSICSGGTANLTLNTTGTGSITVTLTDGKVVNTVSGTSTFTVTPTANTTYTISSVTDQSPHTGTATGTATVSIYAPAAITVQPISPLTIIEGTTTTLSVTATGEPTLNYQWYKNGSAISGANSYSYTTTNTLSAEGTYYVTVSTTCNVVSSTTSTVSVTAIPRATLTGNQSICSGTTATLNLTATGTGSITVTLSNGTIVNTVSGTSTISVSPTINTTYTISSVIDTNSSGISTGSATVSIYAPAAITVQPISTLTIIESRTTTLSVTATGEPILSYQWYKDGSAISGANSYSYTTTNTTSAAGTYYVTVSTTCNVVSSTTSTVSVTAPFVYGTVTSPGTGRVWMDRNLGASRVATSMRDEAAYGDYYQWGRFADGHEKSNSITTTTLSESSRPNHGKFIISGTANWHNLDDVNLWQGENGINNPCPSGFKIPTSEEWQAEINAMADKTAAGAFSSFLKLTLTGGRSTAGDISAKGEFGHYWTSYSWPGGFGFPTFEVSYNSSSEVIVDYSNASNGYSVRCIKEVTPN